MPYFALVGYEALLCLPLSELGIFPYGNSLQRPWIAHFVVRNIFLADARNISRPGLRCFACWRNMRPSRPKAQKSAAVQNFVSFVRALGIEPRTSRVSVGRSTS